MVDDDLITEDADGQQVFTDTVVKFARIRWNSDKTHFVDWDTLTFQALRNEGDSRIIRDRSLSEAYQIILKEKKAQKEAAEKIAAETREVWKFQFDLIKGKEVQEFEMPKGAKILTVKEYITYDNHLKIKIWALVDPEKERTPRQIRIIGSGHEVPKDAIYLGTTFFDSVVLHVWETIQP